MLGRCFECSESGRRELKGESERETEIEGQRSLVAREHRNTAAFGRAGPRQRVGLAYGP